VPDPTETILELEDFAYDLPQNLIAQEPSPVRHESRLLRLDRRSKQVSHHVFKDIAELLEPGDLLVVNDTKVIPARFFAKRQSGGIVEILLIKPEASKPGLWLAMGSPIKRLERGEKLTSCGTNKTYDARVSDIVFGADGYKQLLLDLGSQENTFALLQEIGYAPLPPYIHREYRENFEEQPEVPDFDQVDRNESLIVGEQGQRARDIDRYQTVFAKQPGAVAAPTAGLHFSDQTLISLNSRGVEICKITLHVGPGTFKPISESVEQHHVEPEQYWISNEVAAKINQAKGESRRIIAVGTTTCRALESAREHGVVQAITNQSTSLYIKPGFNFQVINGLITNFHLSKSSLLVLVSAFAGHDAIVRTYKIAIENQYRFFSYGDAMLIL